MRWTFLLSMLLAGVTAQAQAAAITITGLAKATAYAGSTNFTGPAATYRELGSASKANAVTALTAADVALLQAQANSFLDRDVVAYAVMTGEGAPQIRNSPAPVPEPPTLPLVAGSLAALALVGFGSRRGGVLKAI